MCPIVVHSTLPLLVWHASSVVDEVDAVFYSSFRVLIELMVHPTNVLQAHFPSQHTNLLELLRHEGFSTPGWGGAVLFLSEAHTVFYVVGLMVV